MDKKNQNNQSEEVDDAVVTATIIETDLLKHSTQLQITKKSWGGTNAISPPHDPVAWGAMPSYSTRLTKCIATYVQNTVGYGWLIKPTKEVEDAWKELSDELKRTYNIQKNRLEKLFNRPNKEMPFTEVMRQEGTDEEATGNGYLEIVRNLRGEPAEIYHAPASITRRKEGTGFIQMKQGKTRYFKDFGDKHIMNKSTGEYEGDELPLEDRATEIIQFKIYSPNSPIYGSPRYLPAAPAISGGRAAAVRNMMFFKNNAVPPIVVTVTGGALSPDSVESIRSFMATEQKGLSNQHRAMVLQSESSGIGTLGNSGAKIDVKEVGVGSKDDASFMDYRAANDNEIREAFGIGEVFLGTMKDITKGNAVESRRITNDQEFKPAKKVKEYKIHYTIIEDMFSQEKSMSMTDALSKCFSDEDNLKKAMTLSPLERRYKIEDELDKQFIKVIKVEGDEVKFKYRAMATLEFIQPRITDPVEDARVQKIYSDLAALTINEIRQNIGKQPYTHKWADLPIAILLQLDKIEKKKVKEESNGEVEVPETNEDDGVEAITDKLLAIRDSILKDIQD